ncbi:MAG: hypothetical protein LKJ88_06705 [Bacilli bacterium]|jgi:competence protein ComFC|nr:hypothetical protein [Bacilli bacterium]
MLSEKLKKLTARPVCKICFKDIKGDSLLSFFNPEVKVCSACFKSLNYHFSFGTFLGHKIISLAEYKEPMSTLLIRYKETLDIELAPVFLSYYAQIIGLIFKGYQLVLVPSTPSKLKKRGFDHLWEMFKFLGLTKLDILSKDETKDQKKKNALERKESEKLFHIHEGEKCTGKKILLVDDVITSGASLSAAVKLIEPMKPKKIVVLVLMNDAPLANYSTLN